MNKIIALNWKHVFSAPLIKGDKGGFEEAHKLMKTVEDVANIYPEYSWVVFPGDSLIPSFLHRQESISETIQLGTQGIEKNIPLPYSLIWHISQRLAWKTDEDIQKDLESVIGTTITPILCVGPLREEDTLELVLREQLIVLENWPKEKEIVIAYEPGFAIGTGTSMSLEDIEIVTDILREALKNLTHVSILYGGSVDDHNIANILRITDGVIIGTASQKSASLLAISIALWQEG